jgi:hypothetical protein
MTWQALSSSTPSTRCSDEADSELELADLLARLMRVDEGTQTHIFE